MNAAKQQYDYIIIDTPPLGEVIDAAVVAPICDGTVIVMSDRAIRYRVAQNVVAQLQKGGSRILGVVCNNVHGKKRKYGSKYYGAYGKYQAYGKYYRSSERTEKAE